MRRMRFSLKAVFVVVTLAGVALAWVGWQFRCVREREALLGTPGVAFSVGPAPRSLPQAWALLGAKPIGEIRVHPAVSGEIYFRLMAAFPESQIYRETRDDPAAPANPTHNFPTR